jgi:hypothetical protein
MCSVIINVVWMYLRNHLVVRAAASAPPSCESVAQLPRVHYNFNRVGRLRRYLANVEPALSRVRCGSCERGPAVVKTRSREPVRVNRESFRHSRAGGDDDAVCRRRMRSHAGGGCGSSEQSDSHEPSDRSMSRHEDLLLWSQRPLVVGHGNFAKVQQQCVLPYSGRLDPIVAENRSSRTMSDRKRTRPNRSESANYGKGISSVGNGLLPRGQPVWPFRD